MHAIARRDRAARSRPPSRRRAPAETIVEKLFSTRRRLPSRPIGKKRVKLRFGPAIVDRPAPEKVLDEVGEHRAGEVPVDDVLLAALAVAVYVTKVPIPFVNKGHSRSADQDAAETRKNRDWDPNAALYGKNPAKPAPPAASPTARPITVSCGCAQ